MSSEPWHLSVLAFWFEELSKKEWYTSTKALDETIRTRFSSIRDQLSIQTDLPDDADSDQAVASIIVLDQFSRNMFRGSADAFASDKTSLHFAKQAIDRQLHTSMTKEQKQFLFMPFMHSEELADHKQSLPYFEEMGMAEPAMEHMELIERFGRFPHRNAVLGRESTEQELVYLENARRFGQ